ncbi:MAG: hypothetical protein P1V20_03345 [Verrucomicrobiales bacterium]|nr:hypothetical protein [Verrucomicrobiales bacterium]
MNIFILGSEGSGKTVLLAMLSRCAANSQGSFILEPVDYASSQYVIEAQSKLEEGDWPSSTRQGELKQLKWKFGQTGHPLHFMEMYDSAGQDHRAILLEDDPALLSSENQRIRMEIDSSDILVFLFDLAIFYETTNLAELNENAWLFKTFLTRPSWQTKQRIVVATKYDAYQENFNAVGGDTVKVIKNALPTNYSLDHLIDENSEVVYLAVTSVVTETILDGDGNPKRIPEMPLNPSGLINFGNTLVNAMQNVPLTPSSQTEEDSDLGCVGWFWTIIFLILWILFWLGAVPGCVEIFG